jgi:hypothetical protein
MTTNQRIKLNMFLSVRNFGNLNEAIVKTINKFLSAFTALLGYIDEIQLISEAQDTDKTGLTIDKNKLKKSLVSIAFKNANKLSILAKQTNNNTLLNEVGLNESELLKLPEVRLRDQVQIIYDRVQANLENLAEQNVTPETQKKFLDTIKAFNISLASPRSVIAERRKATQQLYNLFKNADATIDIMDLAASSVRDELPDFFNGYKAARTLVNTSSGSIALRAIARELFSGIPVHNAIFTFHSELPSSNGNGQVVKKTSEKGNLQLKSINPGMYKVIVTKLGYKNKEVSIIVNEGERCEMAVELEKE